MGVIARTVGTETVRRSGMEGTSVLRGLFGRRRDAGGRRDEGVHGDDGGGPDAGDAGDALDAGDADVALDAYDGLGDVVSCATCGRALGGDPDEDATGDGGRPICGECARERDFFVMDVADGRLDGRID